MISFGTAAQARLAAKGDTPEDLARAEAMAAP
jgi:type IV pilus biogenesis protein CpaD/CtpE